MAPLNGWGSQLSQGYRVTTRRQFTFYNSVRRSFWYSFDHPRKDKRLSGHWSHPMVLNPRYLDWESSALITRPLSLLFQVFVILKSRMWHHQIICFLSEKEYVCISFLGQHHFKVNSKDTINDWIKVTQIKKLNCLTGSILSCYCEVCKNIS